MATATSLRRGIQQYQAGTGRRITPEALQALLAAELDVQASRQSETKALELQEKAQEENIKMGRERLALDRERMEKEAGAAKMSGITQLGGTAIQGAMLLKDTALGKAISGGVGKAIGGMFTPAAAFSAAPAAAGFTGGQALASFAPGTVGAEFPALAAAGYTPGALGTATAPGAAGTSALGTAAGTALGAASGAGIGRFAANTLGSGSTTEDVGTIGGGATAGFIIGGPVGAVIGAGVGVAFDFVSDKVGTVICNELHRQGYLPLEILELDGRHRRENIDDQTYAGYLKWALPLSGLMRRSKIVTWIVRPFATAWAYEMAHQVKPEIKGRLLGKVLIKLGAPICYRLGGKKEACYGT